MNSASKTATSLLTSLLVCILIVSAGCFAKSKASSAPKISKPDVVVDDVKQEDVQLYIYVTGRTEPFKFVDVTARVPGYLQELHFDSGQIVKQGEKLAQIEKDQYQIALDSAVAEHNVNKAREQLAKSNLDRARQLVETKTISTEEYQSKLAEHQIMLATVERSKTSMDKAKLDLSYTTLIAPIPGKASKQMVDVGNLVGPGSQATTVLTIAQMDPLYIDFEISDKQFTDLKNRMGLQTAYDEALAKTDEKQPEGKTPPAKNEAQLLLPTVGGPEGTNAPFDISLMSSETSLAADYSLHGELVAVISNEIQYETGQIMLRGVVRNPLLREQTSADYLLYPGQICRVRVPYEKLKGAVLVREEAIQTDLDSKYVLVIKEGDYTPRTPFGKMKDEKGNDLIDHGFVVFRRDIKIGKLLDSQLRIVLDGLDPGEKYVVRGIQKAQVGSAITPIELSDYLSQRQTDLSETEQTETEKPAEKTDSEPKTQEDSPKSSETPSPELKSPVGVPLEAEQK